MTIKFETSNFGKVYNDNKETGAVRRRNGRWVALRPVDARYPGAGYEPFLCITFNNAAVAAARV